MATGNVASFNAVYQSGPHQATWLLDADDNTSLVYSFGSDKTTYNVKRASVVKPWVGDVIFHVVPDTLPDSASFRIWFRFSKHQYV